MSRGMVGHFYNTTDLVKHKRCNHNRNTRRLCRSSLKMNRRKVLLWHTFVAKSFGINKHLPERVLLLATSLEPSLYFFMYKPYSLHHYIWGIQESEITCKHNIQPHYAHLDEDNIKMNWFLIFFRYDHIIVWYFNHKML